MGMDTESFKRRRFIDRAMGAILGNPSEGAFKERAVMLRFPNSEFRCFEETQASPLYPSLISFCSEIGLERRLIMMFGKWCTYKQRQSQGGDGGRRPCCPWRRPLLDTGPLSHVIDNNRVNTSLVWHEIRKTEV